MPCNAQQTRRVLFVGNSYTYVNDLPQMVANMAASVGDQLVHTSSTPGGCTFQQHCINQSMTLIRQGGWDAVVLQEQSQLPSFPQEQVEVEVFPFAAQLVDSIYSSSPCAEPIFYMTWGRRDGDQDNAPYFPVLGSYEGMDSMLCQRYMQMAADNDASLCPVGRVWRKLRAEHPDINLYADDGSHPSLAGTYAAACAFYAVLFHHDPADLTFGGEVADDDARTIRAAASEVVWSSADSQPQSQWIRPQPYSAVQFVEQVDSVASFRNSSMHADSLLWSFGDGTTLATGGDIDAVSHPYADTGSYTVTVVASRHCMCDTASILIRILASDTTVVDPLGIGSRRHDDCETQPLVFPTVTSGKVNIATTSASCVDVTLLAPHGEAVIKDRLCGTGSLDLTPFSAGIYLLMLRQDGKTTIRKVVRL